MIRVDTNYIIRYLVNDNIEMADIAEETLTTKNVFISNLKVIKDTFEIFKTKNLDFVDCLLCAYSHNDEIFTFDKKLNKCIVNQETKQGKR